MKYGKVTLGIVISLFVLISGFLRLFFYSTDTKIQDAEAVSNGAFSTSPMKKISSLLLEKPNFNIIEDHFQKGDTLSKTLIRHDVPVSTIHYLAQALKKELDLGKINPGTPYTLYFSKNNPTIEKIKIRINKREFVEATQSEPDTWMISRIPIDTTITTEIATGSIESSLWESARQAGIEPSTILDLADIFSWQIDFATDIRSGDRFAIAIEKEIFPDNSTMPGRILSAIFINQGKTYQGFYYQISDDSGDFYDENGQSLRRAFLKSPLRYRYISSGFSRSRYHPILKIYRPHLGIDYAAPRGTPVSALGDGVVIFKGWKGGYGNYVEVKHGDAYVTCYGHLSGYAKGVRKGVKVRQGQIIGYVGSTGLSTGPHLDFRVRYRNQYINPISIKSPPSEPLPDTALPEFQAVKENWINQFNSLLS